MDINLIRSLITVLLFLAFVTLMILLIMRGKEPYEQAANLPFIESEDDE